MGAVQLRGQSWPRWRGAQRCRPPQMLPCPGRSTHPGTAGPSCCTLCLPGHMQVTQSQHVPSCCTAWAPRAVPGHSAAWPATQRPQAPVSAGCAPLIVLSAGWSRQSQACTPSGPAARSEAPTPDAACGATQAAEPAAGSPPGDAPRTRCLAGVCVSGAAGRALLARAAAAPGLGGPAAGQRAGRAAAGPQQPARSGAPGLIASCWACAVSSSRPIRAGWQRALLARAAAAPGLGGPAAGQCAGRAAAGPQQPARSGVLYEMWPACQR